MFRVLGHRKNYRQPQCLLLMRLNSDVIPFFRHKSHYTSLGLKSNASSQDIKSAYYKLSLKYHPDKNDGSVESVEKFREITEAYEVLSNHNKKKIYDESLNYRYSESEWRRQNYSPRAYQYNERSKPRTGRSKYYNYDEHYKQHYEEYEKQRHADFEYFKHRWEADFRRRYPFSDKPNWSEYQQKQQIYPEWKKILPKKYLLYFLWLSVSIFLASLPILDDPLEPTKDPKKKSVPFYYKIKTDEDNGKNDSKN